MDQQADTPTLQDALGVLRRRLPLILLCAAVVGAAAYGFSELQARKYTATASLAFSDNSLSQQIAGLPPGPGTNVLVQQAGNLELVRLGDMAAKAAVFVGHGLTQQAVIGDLNIAAEGESGVVGVSATAGSPTLAAAIANAYSRQFVDEQQAGTRGYFRSALALVERQLARLSPGQRVGPDGVALQDRAQTLGLLSELRYSNVQLAQEATPPTSASAPRTSRNTILGVTLGLLIGLGLAFALERLDARITRREELASIYGVPLLGVLAEGGGRRTLRGGTGEGAPQRTLALSEAFRGIRAHLRLLHPSDELQVLLVTSGERHEGKTALVRGLAEAGASAGARVLLVEADLRHPTLAVQLGLHGAGLVEVLSDATPLDQAVRPVSLQLDDHADVRPLDVLCAGASSLRNPWRLLDSEAMFALIEQARAGYDLVLLDTPALAEVSDAFPLLTRVDGVIIVGRIRQSRRETAARLHQILMAAKAPLLGVVASGRSRRSAWVNSVPSTPTRPVDTPRNGAVPPDRVTPAGV